ncbi:MAG: hypothetical protein QOH64_1346, partial [Acidimicrobiaceae bacterium]
ALGTKQESFRQFVEEEIPKGLTAALQHRDEPFGDYRTTPPHPGTPRPHGGCETVGSHRLAPKFGVRGC